MHSAIRVILADDDRDDQFLFIKAMKSLDLKSEMILIPDVEKLMSYLSENLNNLPDILFLDLNMPRKNGSECLTEIKQNKKLKNIPIVIYSTSFHEDIVDLLYRGGAHLCIRKRTDPADLCATLELAVKTLREGNNVQPPRDKFVVEPALP